MNCRPTIDGSRRTFTTMMARMKALEAHHHAGADAEVVLVVVGAVIEGGDEVVGFKEANRETAIGLQIEASADVGGEGCAGVSRAWIAAFNECAGRVRQARKNLSERLHGPMVNVLMVSVYALLLMLPACAMVKSPTRANLPVLTGHAKVALPPLRLMQVHPPGGALLRT
jgi:hypothetical protein